MLHSFQLLKITIFQPDVGIVEMPDPSKLIPNYQGPDAGSITPAPTGPAYTTYLPNMTPQTYVFPPTIDPTYVPVKHGEHQTI